MALDDLLADRQSYAGAGELLPFVQPLEHAENLFEVLRVNSRSVVLHRKYPSSLATLGGGDVDPWDSRPLVLDGITDKVLKQLNQLHLVRLHGGQAIVRYKRTAFFDGAAQIHERLLQCSLTGSPEQIRSFCPGARIGQQIFDQPLHSAGP